MKRRWIKFVSFETFNESFGENLTLISLIAMSFYPELHNFQLISSQITILKRLQKSLHVVYYTKERDGEVKKMKMSSLYLLTIKSQGEWLRWKENGE